MLAGDFQQVIHNSWILSPLIGYLQFYILTIDLGFDIVLTRVTNAC